MSAHEVIKIAVAHQSMIIRTGVINTLKRTLEGNIVYSEIAHPEDFETRMRSFAPDILIADPLFVDDFSKRLLQTESRARSGETFCIALLSTLVPKGVLNDFNSRMTIFDNEQSIKETLSAAMPHDEGETQSDGEEQLSARERQVIRGVVRGLTNKEIAQQMNLSVYTVLTHRRNIAKKLQIHSSIALAMYAISNNIVSVGEVKS